MTAARGYEHTSSENREIEEYCSEDEDVEHSVGDKRTVVTKNHSYEPFANGESERFKTEVVTSQTSTHVTKK